MIDYFIYLIYISKSRNKKIANCIFNNIKIISSLKDIFLTCFSYQKTQKYK